MHLMSIIKNTNFKVRFFVFTFLFSLFFYSVIHQNYYYVDDTYRTIDGNINMIDGRRYLSQLLFIIINASDSILDLAPLTQIISIIILSFTLTWFSIQLKFNNLSSFVALPFVVCSPYFLINFQYRYDIISMSLAFSCAMVPFCIQSYNKYENYKYYIKTICILLAVMNLYQPALNVFLVISCMMALFFLYDEGIRVSLMDFCKNIFIYASVSLIYVMELNFIKWLNIPYLLHNTISRESNRSEITNNLHLLIHNFGKYIKLSLQNFGYHGGNLEYIIGIGLCYGFIMLLLKVLRKQGLNATLMAFFFICCALLSLAGPMFLLKVPAFNVRVLLANGAFISLAICFLIGRQGTFSKWTKVPVIFSAFLLSIQFIIAYQWENAMHAQQVYDRHISDELVDDIYLLSKGQQVTIHIVSVDLDDPIIKAHNWSPAAPAAKNVFHERKIFRNEGLDFYTWPLWTEYYMKMHGLQKNAHVITPDNLDDNFTEEFAKKMCSLKNYDHMIAKPFYHLYQLGDKITLEFTPFCT